ncbi:MAG: HEAT repeat domain-containing protein [Thermoanaerobaculaceae bacterium]
MLLESFAENPETGEAMRRALADDDPSIRLMAARFLGAEGSATLMALAGDPGVPQELAVAAVESLPEGVDLASLAPILDAAATAGRGKVACAAAAALGHLQNPEAGAVLAPHLASPDRAIAAAAARAIGESGDTSHTAALVTALAPGKGDLQVAAAEALARVGTVEAVAALHAAVAADPLDLGLRRAAAAAIAAIQSRLVGAAPGQLAVADGDRGSLSLASSGGGAVELAAEEEPGRERPTSGPPGTRPSQRE